MKIATIIVRILMGGLFLFGSIAYFFHLYPTPVLTGDMKTFNEGLAASKYLMPLVKSLELLCGLAFVSGKFVKLANIVILPVTVNILLTHIFLDPKNLPVAIFLILCNLFLIYRNWEHYKNLFTA
ncbi:DoxX family membrane protein [Flavobacterium sp.]|uniref:DoxX family membrane protein n=1 Tax=Flavobacterium sp. TaxID=239 RepID=UPI00262FFC56|nr:DoxX family membrane protein [Flavobacterium sp.]